MQKLLTSFQVYARLQNKETKPQHGGRVSTAHPETTREKHQPQQRKRAELTHGGDSRREEDNLKPMTNHQFDRFENLIRSDERSKLTAEIKQLTKEIESLRRQLRELTEKQNGVPSSTQYTADK